MSDTSENKNTKTARDSNIELLRIITMLGVIILHYNNRTIGRAMDFVTHGSVNFYILSILESVFICAVDLFILICGYFMIKTQKRSIIKPIKLIVQLIVFQVGRYLFPVIFGNSTFAIGNMIIKLVPRNYFVILYIALYFISPYINIVMTSLDKKQLQRFVLTFFLIFSVYSVLTDIMGHIRGGTVMELSTIGMYGSQDGYTIVNFSLMYIIGAYIKLNEDRFRKIKQTKLVLAFSILVLLDVIQEMIRDGLKISKGSAYSYLNPIVILCAVIAFLIFKNLELGHVSIINGLAKGSFTVFLLHTMFIKQIGIKRFVTGNPLIMVIHIIGSSILVYLICWVVYFVYEKITAPIFKLIVSKFGQGNYSIEINSDNKTLNV